MNKTKKLQQTHNKYKQGKQHKQANKKIYKPQKANNTHNEKQTWKQQKRKNNTQRKQINQ